MKTALTLVVAAVSTSLVLGTWAMLILGNQNPSLVAILAVPVTGLWALLDRHASPLPYLEPSGPSLAPTRPSIVFPSAFSAHGGAAMKIGEIERRVLRRLGSFSILFLYLVVRLVALTLFLALGYWLSDLAYAAGLWPLGAIMRIGLLFSLVGGYLGCIVVFIMAVTSLFVDPAT